MSYAAAISASVVGAAFAVFYSFRSVKHGNPPSEIAYWGAATFGISSFVFVYIFLFAAILGERPSEYLQPDIFGSRSERRTLLLYAFMSAGLSMLIFAAFAHFVSRKA